MSSEKFENLEDDLSTAIGVLRSVIQKISDLNEQKKNAVRQAERKLEEANFTVQEMDSEAKAAPPQYRNSMLGKLRALKRDLEQLSRDLKRRKDQGFQSDNLGLDRDERMEASQRARLFQGMDSLNHTSESLTRTHQIAAETDEVGVEILGELGRQREVLTRTNDRVQKSRVECVLFLASPMWMSMPIYSQVQGPTYLSGLLLQKMSSTSQKHKNFVSEPMGDKSVMELAGIGEVLGGKLQEVGFDKASVVLGQYLVFRKDEELFKEWLKDTCGANKKQQTDCHNCLKEWCDQFL